MDGIVVYFLKSKDSLDDDDVSILNSYMGSKIYYFAYSTSLSIMEEIERLTKGYDRSFYQKIIEDLDSDITTYVSDTAIASKAAIKVDVTNASVYHAVQCMSMGGSGLVEIYISTVMPDGSVNKKRMDRERLVYTGLNETEYMVLDCVSKNPMESKAILAAVKSLPVTGGRGLKGRSKTAVYDSLESLADKGLIDRFYDSPLKKYSSRKPNLFVMNDVQSWDHFSYKRIRAMTETDPFGKIRLKTEYLSMKHEQRKHRSMKTASRE